MRVVDWRFTLFGFEVHIRIVPPGYRDALGTVQKLIDAKAYDRAEYLLNALSELWSPHYPEDDVDVARLRAAIDILNVPEVHLNPELLN